MEPPATNDAANTATSSRRNTEYYTTITKEAFQQPPPAIGTPGRRSSIAAETIKESLHEYITQQLRMEDQQQPLQSNSEANRARAQTEDGAAAAAQTSSSHAASASMALKRRHPHLPPVNELEAYILEGHHADGSVNHFLHIFPDLAEALVSYLQTYPDQLATVWNHLKPILRDIRKRNRLHGRHLIRPAAPICPPKPSSWQTVHGQVIHDDYAWLKEKENPAVMRYLEEENVHADACLAHTKTLQKVLFREFVSRLDESAESAKVTLSDGWAYYTRKIAGAEYRLHCRMDKKGREEVYLDENELVRAMEESSSDAAAPAYFRLGFLRHTKDCALIAYGVDTTGIERYTTQFMRMDTKEHLSDIIPDCYEDFEFSNCGKYAFYIAIDQFERAYQWKRHKIGTSVSEDVLLYEETDEMFCLTMTKSGDKRVLILNSAAQITSESRFIDLSDPTGEPVVLFPRRQKIQYTLEHHYFADADPSSQAYRGYFYVMTNEDSKNHQLFRVPMPSREEMKTKFKDGMSPEEMKKRRQIVVGHRDFVLIEAFHVRARHLIVFERSNCVQNIRIISLLENGSLDTYHYVSFSEGTVYSLWPGSVDEEVADLSKSMMFDTNLLRFTYTSFTQPKQVIDYNMDTRVKTVVHEERVLGPGYDPNLYISKRLWATGVDGTAVPMSIVYRRDLLRMNASNSNGGVADDENNGETVTAPSGVVGSGNPLLLHAYGAYGSCMSPIFSTTRLSLLDRGFVYAVAHVRGGSDMGNGWYLEGKLAKKPNTFLDFISCAEFLIKVSSR